MPKMLILQCPNLLVALIEKIGMGQRWCFLHKTGSFLYGGKYLPTLPQSLPTLETARFLVLVRCPYC